MPTTISILPPIIQQYYSRALLSYPVPKFYDDCRILWGVYRYIVTKLKQKCVKNPIALAKFEKLESHFLELYGRAKAKETEYEKKTKKPFGEPFYHFREINRYRPRLFGRLRIRA